MVRFSSSKIKKLLYSQSQVPFLIQNPTLRNTGFSYEDIGEYLFEVFKNYVESGKIDSDISDAIAGYSDPRVNDNGLSDQTIVYRSLTCGFVLGFTEISLLKVFSDMYNHRGGSLSSKVYFYANTDNWNVMVDGINMKPIYTYNQLCNTVNPTMAIRLVPASMVGLYGGLLNLNLSSEMLPENFSWYRLFDQFTTRITNRFADTSRLLDMLIHDEVIYDPSINNGVGIKIPDNDDNGNSTLAEDYTTRLFDNMISVGQLTYKYDQTNRTIYLPDTDKTTLIKTLT